MIEPTDEMEQAFRDEWMRSMQEDPRSDDPERIADRAGLAAVLAIVERDYSLRPATCDQHHPAEDLAYCELPRGHAGSHSATVTRAMDWFARDSDRR